MCHFLVIYMYNFLLVTCLHVLVAIRSKGRDAHTDGHMPLGMSKLKTRVSFLDETQKTTIEF